jgi:trigger factor
MQSTLEDTETNTVRMTVEVPPEEFAKDLNRAYRKVAAQVRIPGFRRGKAPRQVIDAMVGRDVVWEEFVHDIVPEYYVRAVNEHDLVPITDPEFDDVDDPRDGNPFRFTATVEVRPRVELTSEQYEGLQIEAPRTEPTELEVDEYVDHLRERFAELDTVTRPARKGDYVLADLRGYVHDQEVPEASRMGYLAEVGDENLLPELNKELDGARAGDILKFNASMPEGSGEHAGQEISFQVLVKEIKTKRLPEATDEFATTASEFDTMEELREDIRGKIREVRQAEAEGILRERALEALTDEVRVDLPERLVDDETDHHVEVMERRAERMGITLERLMEAQGIDELRLRADARAHAVREIRQDLALEAVARAESLEASPEEVDTEVRKLADAAKQDPKALRRALERSGRMMVVVGDIIRSKALDLVVARADVISPEGSTDVSINGTKDDSPAVPESGETENGPDA